MAKLICFFVLICGLGCSASVTGPKYTGSVDFDLGLAASVGDLSKLDALLKNGVSPDLATERGWTALHWAASGNQVEAVRFLINKGAKVDSRNNVGATPLLVAVLSGNEQAAQELVRQGASTDAVDGQGRSIVSIAQALGVRLR